MTKTKSTLIVCTLLMACAALLAACGGGVSAREQAMSTEVAALQTQAARPPATAVPATVAPTATVVLPPTQDALVRPGVPGETRAVSGTTCLTMPAGPHWGPSNIFHHRSNMFH